MNTQNHLQEKIVKHLEAIYSNIDYQYLSKELIKIMRLDESCFTPLQQANHWSENDIAIITYGDSIVNDNEAALKTLYNFLHQYLHDTINTVHILPFFPYSSDDGFSVIDYEQVNPMLGNWSHINTISRDFRLMTDLVINHCSQESEWFKKFIKQNEPEKNYFTTADKNDDLSSVVRPRTSDLLREVNTENGIKYVWCTFSHDQVDLNFANPAVLCEMVKIIRNYLDHGARIFRLDAVAFLWKEIGTSCINLPQTHEIIRLIRTLVEHVQKDAVIITETNLPNRENLSYFGNGNEAHAIYNFSLPPLLVNTMLTGDCKHLKSWMMSMPPAQNGTFYFNFIASHDGIGLRPAEGLLDEKELYTLTSHMEKFGGKISYRKLDDGLKKPYEINISLFDAFKGTTKGTDKWQLERYICAHAIMLGLEGIPAFYIHSLLGTENDSDNIDKAGHNRAINRHQWSSTLLEHELDDVSSHHHQVLASLKKLIHIRKKQPAFHPNATMFTLHINNNIFAFWRQSMDRRQSIFCLYNVTPTTQVLSLSSINLIVTDKWYDLVNRYDIDENKDKLVMQPYQILWISNY